jgi:hypothetical protein
MCKGDQPIARVGSPIMRMRRRDREGNGEFYGVNCALLPGRAPPTASIRALPLTTTRPAAKSLRAVGICARSVHESVAGLYTDVFRTAVPGPIGSPSNPPST